MEDDAGSDEERSLIEQRDAILDCLFVDCLGSVIEIANDEDVRDHLKD